MKKQSNDVENIEDMMEVGDSIMSLHGVESIASDLDMLEAHTKKYKNYAYSALLMTLTHETYTEQNARKLWHEIIKHKVIIDQRLGRNVGISVATMDYLSNINGTLLNPLIIEEDKINFIAKASTLDVLTHLYSRDVFDIVLVKEIDDANRQKSPLCLMMIDIDDFKKANDTLGHLGGDKVLTSIGECINESIREMDLASRYGGDEMAIIMPNTDFKDALLVGERIHDAVQQLSFDKLSVTISSGIGFVTDVITCAEDLITSTDKALYSAKQKGKNRIVVAGSDSMAER